MGTIDGQLRGIAPAELQSLNEEMDKAKPTKIIEWAADFVRDGLVMTSSFGADSMCLIHLATQVVPNLPIVLVNTGYLFPETITFMEEMRARFKLNVQEFHTKNEPITWLTVHGELDPRVRQNVEQCCGANKNEVLDRAMRTLAPKGWLRGVRADQSEERKKMTIVQWSNRYDAWAISPILRWSSRDVFYYMKEHDLPHNPLWDQGYVSIGCNPATCTRPVGVGEDERSGRWSGSDKKECGIHLDAGANI